MRKLIGILLCTAFFAVSIQTQACEVKYETPVDIGLDIGAMTVDQVQVMDADVAYSIVPGYDMLFVPNWTISKDVITNRKQLLVDTPLVRIKKAKDRYVNHHSYRYYSQISQPPLYL